MNRIDQVFHTVRSSSPSHAALMPFITAGDPDLTATAALLPVFEAAGASVVELGIPFSDPIADGPVIQESMTYALDHGVRLSRIFDTVAATRSKTNLGLVAMVSYSIVHRHGPDRFVTDAADARFDGLIVPDLPREEAAAMRALTDRADLKLAMLVAPATPIERAKQIAAASSGFVYVVARAGITGEQKTLPANFATRLKELRQATDLPLAVGFGISTAEHVRQVAQVADAAIVGSALVRRIAEQRDAGTERVVRYAGDFVRELAKGLG